MKLPARCTTLAITLVSVAACTEMPVIKPNALHQQQRLSSASHWQLIAVDLSRDIKGMTASVPADTSINTGADTGADATHKAKQCIRIGNPEGTQTRFQQFLADTIAEEIVSPEGMADATKSIPSPDLGGPRKQLDFAVYRRDATDSAAEGCDNIVIESHVIKHAGPPGQPWPGKFTLLAVGAIVIKHVVNAFSDGRVVGAVALGETAWWATSGFRSSDTVTEVVVTVSRLTQSKRYVAQFTNVYYINSGDSGFYEPSSPRPAPQPDTSPTPAELYRQQQLAEERRHQEDLFPATIAVAPPVISACDTTAQILVMGTHLSLNEADYLLGTLSASGVRTTSTLPSDESSDAVWTTEVTFKGLKNSNKGMERIPLAMMGANGRAAVAYVRVDTSCVKPTKTSTPATPDAPPPGPKKPDVSFAPKGRVVGDPVNLCASPVVLDATESGGAIVTAVETAGNEHSAGICQDAGQHKKLITFAHLPVYKSESDLPEKHEWQLLVTLATGKPLTKSVHVGCDPPKPAAPATPKVQRIVK